LDNDKLDGSVNRRRRAIRFGDDPEFRLASVVIDRKESQILVERYLVFLAIRFADIAPIALAVTLKADFHVFGMKHIQGMTRDDDLS
jgi:hypothetical protein